MKGVKKCYGLLLALAIIFGLSLSVSSDTSALKYAYDAFPLYQAYYYNQSGIDAVVTTNPTFSIRFDSNSSFDSDVQNNGIYKRCDDDNRHFWSFSWSSNYNYFNIYSGEGTGFVRTFNKSDVSCYYQATDFAYDSIYSAKVNTSNGDFEQIVDVKNLFFDSGDSLYDSGGIKYLRIPLNISHDNVGVIPANTPLSWDFGLVQKSANNFPYFDSDVHIDMMVRYLTSSGQVLSVVPECTLDDNFRFQTRSSDLWETYLGFNVHCSYTSTTDMDYIIGWLTMYGCANGGNCSANPTTFLEYDYNGLYFSGSYFVTNNDSTWSGLSANDSPSGNDLESAPGYHQLYGYDNPDYVCAEGDFGCQLENLFSDIWVLNPFLTLFGLFTDGSSCADITLLSSMIHSEETEVCPYFDSSTRNIVTPVIAVLATAILFGFIMRWLTNSSGNYKDDGGSK